MHKRFRTLGAALTAAAAFAGLVGMAPTADAGASATTQRFDENSTNWAGYYVRSAAVGPVTEVSTRVVTPKPKLLPPTLSASWVGIGGAPGSTDLIQAGVAFGQLEGYYAWYEMLPAGLQRITSGCSGDPACTVAQDDQLEVNIKNLGGNTWNIAITDLGKWSWSQNFDYASSMSSADWIFEAPAYSGVYTIPARFDHAQFYDNSYVAGGQARPLNAAEAVRSNVSPVGFVSLATASEIRPDTAFAVCPYEQSCATP